MSTLSLPTSRDPGEVEARFAYLRRWLRVWIALLVVATLVIVAYLILIAMALSKVNANMAVAEQAVRAVRANVSILPGQVNTVNSHLAAVDGNLKEVPGRLGEVNRSLEAVDGSLQISDDALAGTAETLPEVRESLVSTDDLLRGINGSLQGTNGSLRDTGSLLGSVDDLAGRVELTLEDAEAPPNRLDRRDACPSRESSAGSVCTGRVSEGAEGIYERVAVTNSRLVPVRRDTSNIVDSLGEVDGHLESICESPTLQPLGGFPPC